MGKKSLFQPTAVPEKEKSEPAPATPDPAEKKKAKATAKGQIKPESGGAKKPAARSAREAESPKKKAEVPKKKAEAPASAVEEPTGAAAPATEIPGAGVTDPVKGADTTVQKVPYKTSDSQFDTDQAPFETDPLVDQQILTSAIAAVCGIIFILLIASMINSGNYYIKENRGAVEIWKGDFTPAGKDRILILHGTHWDRKIKDSYSMEEAFSFAAAYYFEKARLQAEVPVSDDFDRTFYYLGRVRGLYDDRLPQEVGDKITAVEKYMTEARILQASGEDAAVSLAQKKIDTVDKILTGLISDLAGKDRKKTGKKTGH